jgi:hypothetical protein
MMRVLILAAILLATAACGAYTFAGGTPSPSPNTGTLSGRVLVVPCAPVERVGSPCSGKPAPGLEIDYLAGTTVVGRTITDGAGDYAIRLEPGTYTVAFKNYMRVVSGPTKITIASGSSVVANYILDSGIRVPVPQQ